MDLGGTIARAGLADSARSVLLRARDMGNPEIDATQELLHIEAYMRSLLGDNDEAIDLLKRYVAANPDHDFAHTASTGWDRSSNSPMGRFSDSTFIRASSCLT